MTLNNSHEIIKNDLSDIIAKVDPVTIAYTANDPSITPNGSVTVADGSTPTVDELLELVEELNAKIEAIATALQNAGLMVS